MTRSKDQKLFSSTLSLSLSVIIVLMDGFGRGRRGLMVIDLDWHGAIQSVQVTEEFMSEGFCYEIDKVTPG